MDYRASNSGPQQFSLDRVPTDLRDLVSRAIDRAEVFGVATRFTDYQLNTCESPIEYGIISHIMIHIDAGLVGILNFYPQVWVYDVDMVEMKVIVRRLDFVVGLNWELITHTAFSGGELIREYFSKQTWGEKFLPFFAVECDGRDSHSHYDQVENDKRRDRRLSTLGLPVIRFTGREIVYNGETCAREILTLFGQNLRETFMQGINLEDIVTLTSDTVSVFRGLGLSLGYDQTFRDSLQREINIPPY